MVVTSDGLHPEELMLNSGGDFAPNRATLCDSTGITVKIAIACERSYLKLISLKTACSVALNSPLSILPRPL